MILDTLSRTANPVVYHWCCRLGLWLWHWRWFGLWPRLRLWPRLWLWLKVCSMILLRLPYSLSKLIRSLGSGGSCRWRQPQFCHVAWQSGWCGALGGIGLLRLHTLVCVRNFLALSVL